MRRNAERNRRLFEYYLRESDKHGSTYKDVAEKFGISASRAWRIVKAEQNRLVELSRRKILLENN
jgi:predicted DNA-binding protein (UPF0251 family)